MQFGRNRSATHLALGAFVGAGLLAWTYLLLPHKPHDPSEHIAKRSRSILLRADQIAPNGAVVVGDSITELALFEKVCGLPVLNAGVAGARLSDIAALAPKVAQTARPRLVVIAIGVNDTIRTRITPLPEWTAAYARLIDRLAGQRLILVGIQPVEDGKPFGPGFYDRSTIAARNQALRGLAHERGLTFVEPPPSARRLTTDGVHLNPAGYRQWLARIDRACPHGNSAASIAPAVATAP